MTLVHYNTTTLLTACNISKRNVYITNNTDNVNCNDCLVNIHLNKLRLEKEEKTSMVKCEYCQTELPENHPGVIAQRLDEHVNWGQLESDSAVYGYAVGRTFTVNGLTVEVVAKKLKPAIDELEDGYYDSGEGAYSQGTVFGVYVVIKCQGNYFKKSGTADSYGEISWNKALRPTTPTTRTIVEYK